MSRSYNLWEFDKMKKMFAISIIVPIILNSLVVINLMSEHVSAQYYAPLTFDESIKSVDVSLGSNCTVIFNGILHVEWGYPTSTEFYITKSQDIENWTVAVSPNPVGLSEGAQTANVTVIVTALPETNSNVSGVITIEGTTRTTDPVISLSNDFSSQVTVIVKKYYMLSISSSEPYKEISPGSSIIFNFSVINLGNTMINDLYIDIENKDKLGGWIITLPSTAFMINASSTINVSISIATPQKWSNDIQEIIIKAESEQANISKKYSLYVRFSTVKKGFIPGFEAISIIAMLGVCVLLLNRRKK